MAVPAVEPSPSRQSLASSWDDALFRLPSDLVPLDVQLLSPQLTAALGMPYTGPSIPDRQPVTRQASHEEERVQTQADAVPSRLQSAAGEHGLHHLHPHQFPAIKLEAAQSLARPGALGPAKASFSTKDSQHTGHRRRASQEGERAGGSSINLLHSWTPEEAVTRAIKRPRLVWTPDLHARFVDAVKQLDLKHAVPKTIMQLMGVEGLTRENVASHLQKYRLQLRRGGNKQAGGGAEDGARSNSDGSISSMDGSQSPRCGLRTAAAEVDTAGSGSRSSRRQQRAGACRQGPCAAVQQRPGSAHPDVADVPVQGWQPGALHEGGPLHAPPSSPFGAAAQQPVQDNVNA